MARNITSRVKNCLLLLLRSIVEWNTNGYVSEFLHNIHDSGYFFFMLLLAARRNKNPAGSSKIIPSL